MTIKFLENHERLAIGGTAALLWSAILGASAIFGSYAMACVFPFAAMATIAAITLGRWPSVGLVASVWVVNQVVGFGFRNYPHTLDSAGWGLAIGVGAFGALAAARAVMGRAPKLLSARTPLALVAAFVAYEGLLFVYALWAGGTETFAADIVGSIAANDLAWFAGLATLYLVLAGAAPSFFRSMRVLNA